MGIYLYSLVYAGIAGLALASLLSVRMFKSFVRFFNCSGSSPWRFQLSAALLAGLYLQAFVANDYGFTTSFGMTLIAVLNRKLADLMAPPLEEAAP